VILSNLKFWIEKNICNERHFHDGHYWTYNSNEAFRKQFPWIKKTAFETALKKLVDAGEVIVGNYNTSSMDRTRWFALPVYERQVLIEQGKLEEVSDFSKSGNGFPENGKCDFPKSGNVISRNREMYIRNTDIKPDINTDTNTPDGEGVCVKDESKEFAKRVVDYFNERTGKHYSPSNKETQKLINGRRSEKHGFEDFKAVIDWCVNNWTGNPRMEPYITPDTIFRPTKFEKYLNNSMPSKAKAPTTYLTDSPLF